MPVHRYTDDHEPSTRRWVYTFRCPACGCPTRSTTGARPQTCVSCGARWPDDHEQERAQLIQFNPDGSETVVFEKSNHHNRRRTR
jgi:hypothetical protein